MNYYTSSVVPSYPSFYVIDSSGDYSFSLRLSINNKVLYLLIVPSGMQSTQRFVALSDVFPFSNDGYTYTSESHSIDQTYLDQSVGVRIWGDSDNFDAAVVAGFVEWDNPSSITQKPHRLYIAVNAPDSYYLEDQT